MENSSILLPMLEQLSLDIDFVKNDVSIGIEETIDSHTLYVVYFGENVTTLIFAFFIIISN